MKTRRSATGSGWRKKAVIDEKIAGATAERGVVLINTGNGKGKSSAAFGPRRACARHDFKVAVVQFVKTRSDTGEQGFFARYAAANPEKLAWHVSGEGFTWETQDSERDAQAARRAWQIACGYLADAATTLVVLDESTYALKYGWLIAATLSRRSPRDQSSSTS